MISLLKTISIIILIGTMSACSSLPSFLGGSKNTIEALIDAHSVGTYQAMITKNGIVLLQKTYTCTATDATLPKCEEVKTVKVPDSTTEQSR